MGQGIIKVSLEEIARALLIPDGYRPIGMYYDPQSRLCSLIVESDELAEVREHLALPTLQLHYTTRSFPVSSMIKAPK